MYLRTYTFKNVSGKMLGLVPWGREETVEVTKMDIQHLEGEPVALVRYSGQRMEGERERTFFRNIHIPFNTVDAVRKHFIPVVSYSGWLFKKVRVEFYRLELTVKNGLPESISLRVKQEIYSGLLFSSEEAEVTNISGTDCSLEEKK